MVRTNKPIAITIAFILAMVLVTAGCGGNQSGFNAPNAGGESSASDSGPGEPGLSVTDAWVRPAAQGDVSAAYLNLHNNGDEPQTVVGAATPAAEVVELHETRHESDDDAEDQHDDHVNHAGHGSHATMVPVDQIEIAAGETVSFEPGGLHIMLINLTEELAEGDVVPISLLLANGESVEFEAEVRP